MTFYFFKASISFCLRYNTVYVGLAQEMIFCCRTVKPPKMAYGKIHRTSILQLVQHTHLWCYLLSEDATMPQFTRFLFSFKLLMLYCYLCLRPHRNKKNLHTIRVVGRFTIHYGNQAIIVLQNTLDPMALRPRLSTGLPLTLIIQFLSSSKHLFFF